jgi:hypothetical protein
MVEEVPDPDADDSICADFHACRVFPDEFELLMAQNLPCPRSLSWTALLLPLLLLLPTKLLLINNRLVISDEEDGRGSGHSKSKLVKQWQ